MRSSQKGREKQAPNSNPIQYKINSNTRFDQKGESETINRSNRIQNQTSHTSQIVISENRVLAPHEQFERGCCFHNIIHKRFLTPIRIECVFLNTCLAFPFLINHGTIRIWQAVHGCRGEIAGFQHLNDQFPLSWCGRMSLLFQDAVAEIQPECDVFVLDWIVLVWIRSQGKHIEKESINPFHSIPIHPFHSNPTKPIQTNPN